MIFDFPRYKPARETMRPGIHRRAANLKPCFHAVWIFYYVCVPFNKLLNSPVPNYELSGDDGI